MDEKGFMLGVLQSSRRYFNSSEFNSKRLKGAGQDGSREWITIIASVCQDGPTPPPAIIYAAAINNHQDVWYDDLDTVDPVAHFITSPNGWTNDEIGFEWLQHVFDRHTKEQTRNGREYRLLFLDGHSSHINMRFIDYCDENKILLMAYPPHSTHRLQPLDVSLFNPLANYYSQNLDEWLRKHHGVCGINKKHFWSLFKPAFDLAFTKKNIDSGWRKTGLFPLNEEVILSQVRITNTPPPTNEPDYFTITPSDWQQTSEHFKATYGKAITRDERKVYKTIDYLCAKAKSQQIEIEDLQTRIEFQEKNSKRRQPLFAELRAQSDTKAIFFSPAKVQSARILLAQREQDKIDEERRKQVQKDNRAELKLQQEIEKARKQEDRVIAKAERERLAAEKKQAREASRLQKEAKKAIVAALKASRTTKTSSPRKKIKSISKNRPLKVVKPVEVLEVAGSSSRPLRRLPQRFCN